MTLDVPVVVHWAVLCSTLFSQQPPPPETKHLWTSITQEPNAAAAAAATAAEDIPLGTDADAPPLIVATLFF